MPSQRKQPSKCFWEMRHGQMKKWASARALNTNAVFTGMERGNLNAEQLFTVADRPR